MKRCLGITICLFLLSGQVMAKGKWFTFKLKDPKSDQNVITGNSNWTKMGELSGAETVYELLQAKDGTIYAATTCEDKGRVFKSTDKCGTWNATADFPQEVEEILSITQSQSGILYVGTYEENEVGRVFKSVNGGDTWMETGNLEGVEWVKSIIETSDGTLYIGTGCSDAVGRVFKSQDGGETWTPTGDLEGAEGVFSLLETSDEVLYAATGMYYTGEGEAGIYKSIDGGDNWVKTGTLEEALYIFSLIESLEGTLYAAAVCGDPEVFVSGKVFKSLDKGNSWQETQEIPELSMAWPLIETMDGALYVGGSYGMMLGEGKVFKSTNGGDSWLNTGTLEGAVMVLSLLQTQDGEIYAGTADFGDVFKYTPTAVEEKQAFTTSPALTISPNPFNQATMIKYQGISGEINLSIYDATGRLVRVFPKIQSLKPGAYSITWNGKDEKGIEVPPGVYFIQAKTLKGVEVEKILKIR